MAHVMSFLSKVNENYENKSPLQEVVKHDWVPTGRIDFATRPSTATPKTPINPMTSNCLQRTQNCQSIGCGNKMWKLKKWRLATLEGSKSSRNSLP